MTFSQLGDIHACRIEIDNYEQECVFDINADSESLAIKLPEPVLGKFCLFIKYTGIINDKMAGFYRSQYVSEGKTYPIAVTQDLHRMVDLVEFNEVVTGVEIGTNIVRLRIIRQVSDFMPSDGANRFAFVPFHDKAVNDSRNDQPRIVRMVDQIVRHTVFPALAKENPG